MDGEIELEMPSPKRMRLEDPDVRTSHDVPPPVHHLDNSQGTSSAAAENSGMISPNKSIEPGLSAPPVIPGPFHLPGLKMPEPDSILANGYQQPKVDQQIFDTMHATSTNGNERADHTSVLNDEASGVDEKGVNSAAIASVMTSPEPDSATPAPFDYVSPSSGNPMEDVLIENGVSEHQTQERRSEPRLDAESLETLALASEAPVQMEAQNDGLNRDAGSRTKDTTVETNVEAQKEEVDVKSLTKDSGVGENEDLPKPKTIDELLEATEGSSLSFEEAAEANKSNAEAEFEIDSSPYESSSSDDSSDTSSSSDDSDNDNEPDDYDMLSPEEEARRLMAEDGGTEGKATTSVPRTQNEKPDEVVPKPQVSVTEDMKIEELGRVENLVENLVLIKANTSGEYQVLESGSVLCLADRSVIGAVAETLGRVQQPYYSVRFSNAAAIQEAGIVQQTKVFYVTQHSTTVFTQPLKAYKGSDASNLHDEEVGDDELEFSDDEAEAEHRRQVKLQKRARYDAKHGHENGVSGVFQPRLGAPNNHSNGRKNAWPAHPPNPAELSLNYDEAGGDSDGLYTPLARPSNFQEMMTRPEVPTGMSNNRGNADRGGRGRGRGDRGSRGGRGRGNDRGGRSDRGFQKNFRRGGHPNGHVAGGQQSVPTFQNGVNAPPNNGLPPRPPSQSNGVHSHSQTQHSPLQAPTYPAYPSQPHSHPGSTSQYPQSYNQPYPQYQQPHCHPQEPYMQGISRQGYYSQQAYSPGLAYPVQQASPIPPTPPAIPPGAHINPNFFNQQPQSSHQPWYPQQGQGSSPPPQLSQQNQHHPYANTGAGAVGGMSPEAARRLQENLNRLNGMGTRGGSHG